MKSKKSSSRPSVPSPPKRAGTVPDRWEVEDGLRTLTRADEIRKNSHIMRHIKIHAKKQSDVAKK